MTIPELVFWLVVGGFAPLLLIVVIWVNRKRTRYLFEMVFMSPGVNDHFTVYGDTLDFKHKVGETEYEIKAERLYRLKPGMLKRIWLKIRGVNQCFIVVYQDKKTEPVAPVDVKVSARILKEVSESRALDKALRSEFKVPWDLRKIILVIGFLVVAVVIWVMISGEVSF